MDLNNKIGAKMKQYYRLKMLPNYHNDFEFYTKQKSFAGTVKLKKNFFTKIEFGYCETDHLMTTKFIYFLLLNLIPFIDYTTVFWTL